MKKLSSIFLLSLLVCNVLGYTFVTLWNEWKADRTYKTSGLIEQEGDNLVLKFNLAIPYQNNFTSNSTSEKLAIYKGEFYRESKQVYENDTLYVTYQRENISRENFYDLLNEVSENLDDFSKNESDNSSKNTLKFFKNLVKDYTTFGANNIAYFWVEDIPLRNYTFTLTKYSSELSLTSPPPQIS